MYISKTIICAVVIQIAIQRLTSKPVRKYFSVQFFAIRIAQIMKIAGQKIGSRLEGIIKTVASAIPKPKSKS
jgi:hypothetical protein